MNDLLKTAQLLIEWHREEDASLQAAYIANHDSEVRLIEVIASVEDCTIGDCMLPFRFAAKPDLDVNFPSTVVLLSCNEWELVVQNELPMPLGWGRVEDLKRLF